MSNNKIIKDLKTFKIQDLDTLIKYYKVDPNQPVNKMLNELAEKIYKNGNLTRGEDKKIIELKKLLHPYYSTNAPKILEIIKTFPTAPEYSYRILNSFSSVFFYGVLEYLEHNPATDQDIQVLDWLFRKFATSYIELMTNVQNPVSFKKLTEFYIKSGGNINQLSSANENVLFYLVGNKLFDADLLQYLIDHGVDIYQKNIKNQNMLCTISQNNSIIIPSTLFKKNEKQIKGFLKVVFKYLEHDKAGCDIVPGHLSKASKKLIVQALKESYNDKLEILQENLDIIVNSLDVLFNENTKEMLLQDLEKVKVTKIPDYNPSKITMRTLDKIKKDYENRNDALEKKIKYINDAITYYPGGKEYKKAKQDFKNRKFAGTQ